MRIKYKDSSILKIHYCNFLIQKQWNLFVLSWVGFVIIFSPHLTNKKAFAQTAEHESSPQTSINSKPLKEDQIDFVESEQILSNTELWQGDGLRVDLAYVQAEVTGLNGSPNGLIQGIQIGIGTRLDPQWSLSGSLRYGVGRETLSGLNFSGLLSSIFHWYGLGLGLGIGVVGIDERPNARQEAYPTLSSEICLLYTSPSPRD